MTEITYTRQGDFYLPDLKLPNQDNREIGIWGQRRRRYLRDHHKILYYNLLTQCKLIDHLADINEEAEEMYSRLVKQFAVNHVSKRPFARSFKATVTEK